VGERAHMVEPRFPPWSFPQSPIPTAIQFLPKSVVLSSAGPYARSDAGADARSDAGVNARIDASFV
jgi:hypothetical protein